MSDAEVIVEVEGAVGRLTLNRPEALGVLTMGMCEAMTEALAAWRRDGGVRAVLIDHAGDRGFCAGGDVRILAQSPARYAQEFFFREYRLNHLLFTYAKPVATVMDGLTMGGGVGISWPACYRVATGRTAFAMPETGIGHFPDIGGGWFLPRLPGAVGMWLGLTGARLKAPACRALGIATHVIPTAQVEAFKQGFIADPDAAAALLAALETSPPTAPSIAHRDEIDRIFGRESVEAIIAALEREGTAWAAEQLNALRGKSPLSLKTALRQMKAGAAMTDFAEVMTMEMRLAARIVPGHDFREGVRAVVVDKETPRWDPATLAGVTDAMLDAIFAPLPAGEEWSPQ